MSIFKTVAGRKPVPELNGPTRGFLKILFVQRLLKSLLLYKGVANAYPYRLHLFKHSIYPKRGRFRLIGHGI